jgi:molybdenum cofactor biosynthesis enzyme MoaA
MSNLFSAELVETQVTNLSQITFEVTDACNFKCKYCGYGELYASLILNRKFFEKNLVVSKMFFNFEI